jgi:hypothetical protein
MKKLMFVILVVIAASFGVTINTGCSGSGEPVPQDTTDNDTTPVVSDENGFKIGFDTYKLDVVEALTYGVYNKAANKTYIFVSGQDASQAANEENADFALEVDSNVVGTYTKTDGARIDVGTGSGIKRLEYTSDGASITIIITQYDAVGGRIKGTFSGSVKESNAVSTTPITGGYFDVLRKPDE